MRGHFSKRPHYVAGEQVWTERNTSYENTIHKTSTIVSREQRRLYHLMAVKVKAKRWTWLIDAKKTEICLNFTLHRASGECRLNIARLEWLSRDSEWFWLILNHCVFFENKMLFDFHFIRNSSDFVFTFKSTKFWNVLNLQWLKLIFDAMFSRVNWKNDDNETLHLYLFQTYFISLFFFVRTIYAIVDCSILFQNCLFRFMFHIIKRRQSILISTSSILIETFSLSLFYRYIIIRFFLLIVFCIFFEISFFYSFFIEIFTFCRHVLLCFNWRLIDVLIRFLIRLI